jgi:hypothetical protein
VTGAAFDPQDRLFAVFDDRTAADVAARALRVLGVPEADIDRYEGATAADAFDGTGRLHGPLARLRRAVQFSLADQMPDLAWYEAALRDGRVVLSSRTHDNATTRRAVAALVGAGGHFINRFGRLQTEEYVRWRGPEPAVHHLLRR